MKLHTQIKNFLKFAKEFSWKILIFSWKNLKNMLKSWNLVWKTQFENSKSKITVLPIFRKKKIWYAIWARVNLPHIGNKICINFDLIFFFVKNSRFILSYSKFVWYPSVIKFKNSECAVLSLVPKIVTKRQICSTGKFA
jgi:hypothetical protein